MAKRSPQGEEPFRPLLDQSVIAEALSAVQAPLPELPKDRAPPLIALVQAQPGFEVRSRSVSTVEEVRPPPKPVIMRSEIVDKLDQEKRMLLTRRESEAMDRLVSSLGSRLNSQIKLSHLLRAFVSLLLNAESELDRRAGESGVLLRPSNGDLRALQWFEKQIAHLVASALRDAGPLKS